MALTQTLNFSCADSIAQIAKLFPTLPKIVDNMEWSCCNFIRNGRLSLTSESTSLRLSILVGRNSY